MARTPRRPAPPPLPWSDPRRWAFINAFGFALSVFLALFLLLVLVRTVMPKADALESDVPMVYIVASLLTCLGTVALAAYVVIGLMARGADLGSVHARHVIVLWSAIGLAFALVQLVVLARFGAGTRIPNVASWASSMYWSSGIVALPGFALMTWVNAAHRDGDDDEHHDLDDDPDAWDDEA